MITTIQLNESVKNQLDFLKTNKETYEEIIVSLIKLAEKSKRMKKELLIEECKATAEESLKILEEFKYADAEMDWEWNGDL